MSCGYISLKKMKYRRTPFIRINGNDESSGYSELNSSLKISHIEFDVEKKIYKRLF